MTAPVDYIYDSIQNKNFQPAPLAPEQITGGNPVARSAEIGASPDGLFTVCLWECTAGQFKWNYYCDETVHILEGSAIVKGVGQKARTLKAGDVVYFPHGLQSEWDIPQYVKKLAIFRSTNTSLLSRILGKIRRLLG